MHCQALNEPVPRDCRLREQLSTGGLVQIQQIWPPEHNGRTQVQLGDKNSALKNTMAQNQMWHMLSGLWCVRLCVNTYKLELELILTDTGSQTYQSSHQFPLANIEASGHSITVVYSVILDDFANGFTLSFFFNIAGKNRPLGCQRKLPETTVHT